MLVFKFGGASVKSAGAVRNVGEIIHRYPDQKIVVVVSAMGKTTNALEVVADHYFNGRKKEMADLLHQLKDDHLAVVRELFPDPGHAVYKEIGNLSMQLESILQGPPAGEYDYEYDRIVPFGELFSTKIISAYLKENGLPNRWMDIRQYLRSNANHREARIDWEASDPLVRTGFDFSDVPLYITQGFLASTQDGATTTLGREGSDFTAAVLAHILRAEYAVIWKDVPGVLNADPKWFDDTVLLDKISYLDATELAYYGAGVIHPKTIKPLENRDINLYIKSFIHPEKEGTLVGNLTYDALVPSFIFNMDQVLIRISPTDFSFIAEDNLETIFGCLYRHGVKIKLMQNSALSFQICINNDKRKVPLLLEELEQKFRVSHESGLELITIRYFDQTTIDRVMVGKELILEQRYNQNIQLIVRDKGGKN